MAKFIDEFKAFAMRGNVLDMAVGVIIGGAFGKIVSSLVADVIMPILGILIGGVNFTKLRIVLKHAETNGDVVTPEVALTYGNFLQATFDFLIIAFSIFLFVKGINAIYKRQANDPAPAEAAPTKEEALLTEIRDLLKEQKQPSQD